MTSNLVTSRQLMDSLGLLDQRIRWITCPACHQEWSKLQTCEFLSDDLQVAVDHVCVVCAETLVSLDWLFKLHPISGVTATVKWDKKPRLRKFRIGQEIRECYQPKNAYALITYGEIEYIAHSEGTGHPIRFKESKDENPSFARNIFVLRSKIYQRLKHPTDSELS